MGLSGHPAGARTPGRARGLVGLRAERVAQTLILKGGLVRHPLDLHADPMASPWPALGLLSITCCSCCRCVPARINSRPGAPKGVGGAAGCGAESGGLLGTVPGTVRPLPARSLCPWPGHVLLCCRGPSRLSLACPLSDALSSAVPEPLPGSQCLRVQPRRLGLHCSAAAALGFYHRSPSALLARPPCFPAPFQQQPFTHSISKVCQVLFLHWNTEVD